MVFTILLALQQTTHQQKHVKLSYACFGTSKYTLHTLSLTPHLDNRRTVTTLASETMDARQSATYHEQLDKEAKHRKIWDSECRLRCAFVASFAAPTPTTEQFCFSRRATANVLVVTLCTELFNVNLLAVYSCSPSSLSWTRLSGKRA
jgi:hypothetical protein